MARTCTASTDRVEYTTTLAATTAMSFCCWVKAPSVAGTACKMLACQEDQWRVSFNAEKYGGGTPTAGALYFGRSWGTTDHVAEVQSPGATWANWNHVACTYDGSATTNAAKFYLNGTLLTNSFTRNAAGSIDNAVGNPNVGNDNAHTLSCLASIAWPSFHNVVLTQAEILEHMICGYTGRGQYWVPDLSGDSPERDRSGNGRLGTVTGTTVATDNPPVSLLFMSEDEWTEEVVGGTIYTKTGAATSGASNASGTDQYTATETGSAASEGKASAADQFTATDTGSAVSAASASASDVATFTETGSATSPAVASGSRIREKPRTGSSSSDLSASGPDVSTFSETGSGTSALSASAEDATTYNRSGLAASAAGASGVGTTGSLFEKSGLVISAFAASGGDALTIIKSGIAESSAAMIGSKSLVFARSGLAASVMAALGTSALNPDRVGRNATPAAAGPGIDRDSAAAAGAGGTRGTTGTAGLVP